MYISSRLCCLVRCLTGTIPFPAQCFITLMTCYLSRSIASCHGMSKPDSESLCFPISSPKTWMLSCSCGIGSESCLCASRRLKPSKVSHFFLMHALKIMPMPIWLKLRPMLQHRRWIKNYCLDNNPHSAITTLSPIPLLTNTLLPPTTTDERHERVVGKSAISKEL